MRKDRRVEGLLRQEAPRVLGVLIRRHGRFDECEDAVQEALVAAAMQWPDGGVPSNPYGWLITVASRRLADRVRSEVARRRREEAAPVPAEVAPAPSADEEGALEEEDMLTLLYMCCHPALTPVSQVALTLRAVGALRTAEIARAFLVPEATMAQRISRAKQKIKASGVPFRLPPEPERVERLGVVLHVLYLIFNEGYTATSGHELARAELTGEAIRLARELRRLLPEDGEVAGLLALMLLTDARRSARTTPDGSLVPLAEQNRERWNRELIREGESLVTDSLSRTPLGPYQIQAAIAAVHDEAERAEETDWSQILALYGLLERISDNPMVTLNRAVALSMVQGSRCSKGWKPTGGSRDTTVSTRCAPTCWRWPATSGTPEPATGPPPAALPASPSGATSRAARRGRERTDTTPFSRPRQIVRDTKGGRSERGSKNRRAGRSRAEQSAPRRPVGPGEDPNEGQGYIRGAATWVIAVDLPQGIDRGFTGTLSRRSSSCK